MSTRSLISGATTDPQLAGNWGTTPVSGDTALIPYDATFSTNLNMSAVDLAALVVQNGVTFNAGIESSSTPWQVSVASGSAVFQYFGQGTYVCLSGSYDEIQWHPSGRTQLVVIGGTVTALYVFSGSVTIGALTDWGGSGLLEVVGGTVTVTAKAASLIATVRVMGGVCTLGRDFTNAYVGGDGVLIFDAPGVTGGDVVMECTDRGGFKWIDGNLGTVDARRGEWDTSKLRTASTCAVLNEHGGMIERTSVGTIVPTYTSRPAAKGRGASKVRG